MLDKVLRSLRPDLAEHAIRSAESAGLIDPGVLDLTPASLEALVAQLESRGVIQAWQAGQIPKQDGIVLVRGLGAYVQQVVIRHVPQAATAGTEVQTPRGLIAPFAALIALLDGDPRPWREMLGMIKREMSEIEMPRLVIAAAQSGAGKTTVATGLMAALTRRGLTVQPYKVGPDYIDPTYHTVATGRASRNLDGWMCPPETIRTLFRRSGQGADIALIEGVMGLFDGKGSTSEEGSTAQMAKWLAAPVLLVLDARGMARSAGAILQGLAGFDPDLKIAGVIFNNVGSESHYKLLCEAVAAYAPAITPLGYLPKAAGIKAPERHLGLVPSFEQPTMAAYLDSLADLITKGIDLDAILDVARRQSPPLAAAPAAPGAEAGAPVRIGIARDAAFHFYYEDGLDVLRSLGAELVPFSPLTESEIPPDLDALYLGGGFPEVYRQELTANTAIRNAVRDAAHSGLPIYAECGGLMFLTEAIVDTDGAEWPMAGVIPVKARMQKRLASMGYATAALQGETMLGAPGETLKGHEFHWSTIEERPDDWPPAYISETRRGGARPEGFYRPGLLASYVHIHFAANPQAAVRFVEAARAYHQARQEVANR